MRYHDGFHHGGYLLLAWVAPLILIAGFALALVWVLRRSAPLATPAAAPSPGADVALQAVRMRYARGEIDRDEYARLVIDLGGPVLPPPTTPPAAGS